MLSLFGRAWKVRVWKDWETKPTNGPDRISRTTATVICHCSRVPDQVIQYHQRNWHGKSPGWDSIWKLNNFGNGKLFQGNARWPRHANSTSICIQKSPVCKRQHVEDITEDLLLLHWAQFLYCPEKIINSEPPNIGSRKTKQIAVQTKETVSRAEGSRGLERVCKGVRKRGEIGKCTIKEETADRNTALCYRPQTSSDSGGQLRRRCSGRVSSWGRKLKSEVRLSG